MQDQVIIEMLHEIRNDQRSIMTEVNKLAMTQVELKADLAIARNGYTPHQIVELLHWTESQKLRAERQSDNVRKAIIAWVVPILCSALFAGLIILFRGQL